MDDVEKSWTSTGRSNAGVADDVHLWRLLGAENSAGTRLKTVARANP